MLRTTLSLIIIGLFCAAPFNPSYAQTADEIKARNYVFAAEADYKRRKYEDALDKVEKAEDTLGRTGELPLKIKVQSLYALERYAEAKVALDALYTHSPSEKTQRAVSSIFLDLEERMDAIRAADAERAKQKAAQEQALAEQKIEAERLEAKMRYEATVAQAEAERLAPLIAAEQAKKSAILSAPGVVTLRGDYKFDGKDGASGLSYHGKYASQGRDGRDGGDGGAGGASGNYNIFAEQIKFEHVSSLILMTFQNIDTGRSFSGYWDDATPLSLSFKGGKGGRGGDGEKGGRGDSGKDSTLFKDWTRGRDGKWGGMGGRGGFGGAGAKVNYYKLSSNASSDWEDRFTITFTGGDVGKPGQGGDGGPGGSGGWNIYGTEQARRGSKGQTGAVGNRGRKGEAGFFNYADPILESEFTAKGIALHKTSGPISSPYAFEQVKDMSATPSYDAPTVVPGSGAANTLVGPSDRDAQPLFRGPPEVPAEFLQGSNSGYCRVKFHISEAGNTFNIRTVECTNAALELPTHDAVGLWKYNPKIQNSKPVTRTDVAAKVRFDLSDRAGNLLPLPSGY